MKVSHIKAVVYFHLFVLFGGLIQACCTNDYRISSEGEVLAYEIENISGAALDTIKGPFELQANFPAGGVASAPATGGFFSSAYATQCGENFLNALKEDSFSLTLDKNFVYQNDTIRAGEDLLSNTSLEEDLQANWGNLTVIFSDEFFQEAHFENDYYTFKVKGQTTDDLDLESELNIYIKL